MGIYRCGGCGAMNRIPRERAGDGPKCGRCHARLDASGAPAEVSGAALEQAIASSPVPVLVDFWAPWCGPCRIAAPVIDDLGRRHAGDMLVLKMNVDTDPALASRRQIQGIPAFVLFQGGREIGRRIGVVPRQDLERWIAERAA